MCTEKYVLILKNVYRWAINCLKKAEVIFKNEDRPGWHTMVGIPEMVDSVDTLILANRRVTREDISEQVGIFVDTEHKIVDDNFALSLFVAGFYQDNAKPHMAARTVKTISQFGLTVTSSLHSKSGSH